MVPGLLHDSRARMLFSNLRSFETARQLNALSKRMSFEMRLWVFGVCFYEDYRRLTLLMIDRPIQIRVDTGWFCGIGGRATLLLADGW